MVRTGRGRGKELPCDVRHIGGTRHRHYPMTPAPVPGWAGGPRIPGAGVSGIVGWLGSQPYQPQPAPVPGPDRPVPPVAGSGAGAPGPRTPGTGAGTRPGAACDPRHTGTGRTPGSSGGPPGPPAAAGVLLLLPEPDFLSYFSPDSAKVWRTRSQEGEFASSGSRLLAGPDVTGGTEAGVAGDLTCQ
jgi:hypothetical protein